MVLYQALLLYWILRRLLVDALAVGTARERERVVGWVVAHFIV